MEQKTALAHDVFPHIRIIMGMIIGLGMTKLLSGVARMVQHPKQVRVYGVHLAWVGSMLLMLIHFWWWQFGLFSIGNWTFEIYFFVIVYSIILFLLCALLFPDSMQEYGGYEDYFYSSRVWFFGLLASTYVLDLVDTLLKGEEHFERFGYEYVARTPVMIALCLLAIATPNRRVHACIVGGTLLYQSSWIWRLFNTIT